MSRFYLGIQRHHRSLQYGNKSKHSSTDKRPDIPILLEQSDQNANAETQERDHKHEQNILTLANSNANTRACLSLPEADSWLECASKA
jgi:hypothetical protein